MVERLGSADIVMISAVIVTVLVLCSGVGMALDIDFTTLNGIKSYSNVFGRVNISYSNNEKMSFVIPNDTVLWCDAVNTGCRQIINGRLFKDSKPIGTLMIVHPTFEINKTDLKQTDTTVVVANVFVPVYVKRDGTYIMHVNVGPTTFVVSAADVTVIRNFASGILAPFAAQKNSESSYARGMLTPRSRINVRNSSVRVSI